jgi:hypothetical protein
MLLTLVYIILAAIYGLFMQQLHCSTSSSKKVNSNKHGLLERPASVFQFISCASFAAAMCWHYLYIKAVFRTDLYIGSSRYDIFHGRHMCCSLVYNVSTVELVYPTVRNDKPRMDDESVQSPHI